MFQIIFSFLLIDAINTNSKSFPLIIKSLKMITNYYLSYKTYLSKSEIFSQSFPHYTTSYNDNDQ